MKRSSSQQVTVGIVARRLVSRASVFPVAEKCNMITRLPAALGATGVERVLMMPDVGGFSERLRRAIVSHEAADPWPEVEFLDMQVDDGPTDTVRAVEHMAGAKPLSFPD